MANNTKDHDGGMGEFCLMCGRSDKQAGKMIHLPGGLTICPDCMQKTMDAASKMDFQSMLNNPYFMQNNPFLQGMMNHADQKDQDDAAGKKSEVIDMPAAPSDQTSTEIKEDDEPEQAEGTDEPADAPDEEEESSSKSGGDGRRPSISFLNLGDLFGGGFGGRQQPKVKKKKKNEPKPVFSIDNIPAPHKIKEELDKYVIGQERAKKVISVAAYNHYKRVRTGTMDDIEIEKSNILLLGPTGCGKTYIVKTLARLLDVPLAITDATSLTEAGYIGDDIESVISKLLAAADNDVEKTEKGIVFIDEIDKIAKKKNINSRDVSGESVQQGMLKLLEGADVEVPVGANSKNAMVPMTTMNTKNILFICGGAFPGLEDIIKERLTKSSSMGFESELKDRFDDDPDLLTKATLEDLRRYGMIPEFIGRLPMMFALRKLDRAMLVRILKEPKNAILKQYQKLLALDEVKLEFEDSALEAIADLALGKDTGARALRSIIEEFMLDIMYEIPKDDNIGQVLITGDYIAHRGGPVITMRGTELPALTEGSAGREH